MIKIKFPKEQVDFFYNTGTKVNTANGKTYIYFFHWFRETEEEGVFELFAFENLPDELIDTIKDKPQIKIKSCKECPHFKTANQCSSDS